VTEANKKGLTKDRRLLTEYYERVHRWLDSNTAIVYVIDLERAEPEDLFFNANFVFTLKFDRAGNWEIVKKRPISDKEFDQFQKND
jgi:hypothetical protein